MVDYAILAVYFVVVLGIGLAERRQVHTGLDFFLSGRSLPAWITGLAFIAANLGALEILGLAANGAKYRGRHRALLLGRGDPAMVFLGHRDDALLLQLQGLNSLSFAVATVLIAGVTLFAMALVIRLLLGWPIPISIVLAAGIVLVYITLGGLSSAIYNEVLGRSPTDRVAWVERVGGRREGDPDGPRDGAQTDAELEEVGITRPPLPQPARLGDQATEGARMGMEEGGEIGLSAGGGAQLLALVLEVGEVPLAGHADGPAGAAALAEQQRRRPAERGPGHLSPRPFEAAQVGGRPGPALGELV